MQQQMYNLMAEKEKDQGAATSQIPDLSLIEVLCQDLQRAVHKQMTANCNKLKQSCKSERAKILAS